MLDSVKLDRFAGWKNKRICLKNSSLLKSCIIQLSFIVILWKNTVLMCGLDNLFINFKKSFIERSIKCGYYQSVERFDFHFETFSFYGPENRNVMTCLLCDTVRVQSKCFGKEKQKSRTSEARSRQSRIS